MAFLLLEIALRVLGIERVSFYTYDDELGWAPRPLAEGRQTEEGDAYVRIDAAGFRDHDHALAAPPRTFRIAALGDSYTDAIQVELESTWWHALEADLAPCPALGGRAVEVLDFGVRGYGTAQELLTYRRASRAYHPDLTLLLYTPENDLVENTPELSAKGYLAPFFVYEGDALVLRPPTNGATLLGIPYTFLARTMFAVRSWSRVVGLVDLEAIWSRLRDHARDRNRFHADDEPRLDALVMYAQPYGDADTPVLVDAWRVTDALLEMLASEVRADGGTLAIAVGTSPILAYPDRALREDFARRIGVADLGYSDRHLAALGARLGVEVLPLSPAFEREADTSGAYLHGFPSTGMGLGHWNERGHALAAREIATWICASLSSTTEAPAR